ncbi:MAG: hypothetical protein ACR2L8_13080, partial [Solirubrobacteraceae bacterium]
MTDACSGVATGAQLLRASATLTGGTCGAYGGFSQVGADDPAFPVADSVADDACHRYRYVVSDRVGNQATGTSGDIKVDTTPPTGPTFAFSALTNAYWTGSGATVYYRPAVSGSFTAAATAVDGGSGIASYSMPNLGSGWTAPSGSTGVQTYAWSAGPNAPVGAQNAIATNNASLTATAGFNAVRDSTLPAGGSVSYVNGDDASPSLTVTFAAGTDGGSGLNTTSGVLQRATATLTAGTCGAFGGFATVTG